MRIYGHRGSPATAPENTITGFRHARATGADGVELDVRASADGVLVVSHDRDVSRTTNGSGAIDSLDLATIQALKVGETERIPTLDEVLQLLEGTLRLDIEIKQPDLERDLLTLLARYPGASWAISAFDWNVLREVRRLDGNAELWLLARATDESLWDTASELRATAVALFGAGITVDTARTCREHDVGLVAWTVNQVEEARQMERNGASVLITVVPGDIVAALR